MSQTSYPSVSQPSRANGKTQAAGVAAPSAAKAPNAAQAGAEQMNGSVSVEAIAQRAYEKFVARGGAHGSDQEDWAAAERELIAESRGR